VQRRPGERSGAILQDLEVVVQYELLGALEVEAVVDRDFVAGRGDDDLERCELDRHPVADEKHRDRVAGGPDLDARLVVDDRVGDLGELEGLGGQWL
jgi:hypothetical protein